MFKPLNVLLALIIPIAAFCHNDARDHDEIVRAIHATRNEEVSYRPCEKTYVSLSKVLIDSKGIFVNIDDCLVQVESIQHDEGGLFFSNCNDDWSFYWECKNCGYDGNTFSPWCKVCGAHM